MNILRIAFLSLAVLLLGAPVFAQGNDEDSIKTRMVQRTAQVDALKTASLVGENNKGLLEQRGALKPEQTEVMNAENADRRALYGILGSRLGITVTVVGEQRAEVIRKNSAAGIWLQSPDGNWYKK